MTVAAAKEQVRRQHATVAAVLIGGPTTALLEAARSAALADLGTAASPSLRERWAATVAGAEVDARQRIEQRVLTAMTRGEPLPTAQAGEWDRAAGRTAALIRDVEVAGQQQLATDGAALAASARAGAVRDGVLVALLVLLTVAVVVVVARSLLVPLRTLRGSAFQIARSRLPATIAGMTAVDGRIPDVRVKPIGVDTHEEIGEVARAFDAVHAAAVQLAGEQALLRRSVNDIFASLARRGQNLIGRQLAVLDRLEQRERDPEHRDGLFELEHLATRMRRNTENLLVLAGEAQPRVAPDTDVRELAAAAVAEIELHGMVAVGPLPDVEVRGAVVADLGHLLAELLENATTFAPLDAKVLLDARIRSDDTLIVEIVDEGFGMPSAELAKLNAQLAEAPLFDPAVSRRMGLFVVARLAQRHGIAVVLRARHGGRGLVAGVAVPAALLARTPGREQITATSCPSRRPARTAPRSPRRCRTGPARRRSPATPPRARPDRGPRASGAGRRRTRARSARTPATTAGAAGRRPCARRRRGTRPRATRPPTHPGAPRQKGPGWPGAGGGSWARRRMTDTGTAKKALRSAGP